MDINPRFWSVFSCIIFSLRKDEDFAEDDTEKEEVAAEQKINRRKNFNISCSKPLYCQVDETVRLGQIDQHGLVLEDAGGRHGGKVKSLNSRGEYYRPRITEYNFEN